MSPQGICLARAFARCNQVRPDPAALDRNAQRELWERSAELLDMDEPLVSE